MVRDVGNVNCAIERLLGGILGALGAWKEMEWHTLPSQVPFFHFFLHFQFMGLFFLSQLSCLFKLVYFQV
jgi:hypothetical protein